MTNEELKKIWSEKFAVVPQVLENMKQVQAAATAFNTNVDAVVKISGAKIAELAAGLGMDLAELEDVRQTKLDSGKDVVKGIFKCFTKGIAEEWLTEDKQVYDWMVNNLGMTVCKWAVRAELWPMFWRLPASTKSMLMPILCRSYRPSSF